MGTDLRTLGQIKRGHLWIPWDLPNPEPVLRGPSGRVLLVADEVVREGPSCLGKTLGLCAYVGEGMCLSRYVSLCAEYLCMRDRGYG